MPRNNVCRWLAGLTGKEFAILSGSEPEPIHEVNTILNLTPWSRMARLGLAHLLSRTVPVRTFALRTDSRLLILVTRNPFVSAPLAAETGNFDVRHARSLCLPGYYFK
jgi:hypothetical protein